MPKRLLLLLVVLTVLVGGYWAADHLAPDPMARAQISLQRKLAGLDEKRVQIPGLKLAYLDGGTGEPLVLVHGIGADKDNFTPVAALIKKLGRTIAVDLPGFGDSSQPADGDYGIPAQVEHLRAFLDALQLPRVHLGGSSMGGQIVASFAAKYPERVGSLWLLAPAGVHTAPPGGAATASLEHGEYQLFARTPMEFERVLDSVFSQRPPLPWSVRQQLARRAASQHELHTRIFRDLVANSEAWSLEPQLRVLPTPTLIVWGDQDRALDVTGARILHSLLPDSELVVLPGVGHLPMLEKPFRSARDYREFRQRLANAP